MTHGNCGSAGDFVEIRRIGGRRREGEAVDYVITGVLTDDICVGKRMYVWKSDPKTRLVTGFFESSWLVSIVPQENGDTCITTETGSEYHLRFIPAQPPTHKDSTSFED